MRRGGGGGGEGEGGKGKVEKARHTCRIMDIHKLAD